MAGISRIASFPRKEMQPQLISLLCSTTDGRLKDSWTVNPSEQYVPGEVRILVLPQYQPRLWTESSGDKA